MRKNILILGHNDATQFIDIFNQYTRLFDPAKYEVTVAYLTGEPYAITRERTMAENVLFLNIPKKQIRTLKIRAIKRLLKITLEKKFELVICHRYKPTYIMLWVAQFCKIPALVFVMHEFKSMTSFARQLLVACLARKNMLFAGVSNAIRDDMRKDLWCVPKERIVTLYNMIDADYTEPQLLSRQAARAALSLAEDAFVFGNIARLAHNKDQTTLLQAFALIKPSCPQAKLVIIGDGELEATLKNQVATAGLEQDVIFTGFVPGGFKYMPAFDSFVLSSTQEAFGRVLLEAMIARVPVIASAVNGIPEVIQDVGILVQPKDVTGFAQAMQNIYASSAQERAHLGAMSYQHTIMHFTIPVFQQQFWQHIPLEA